MIYDSFIQKQLSKKNGKLSVRTSALKAAEPITEIGIFTGAAIALCRALGIDIDENGAALIGSAAVVLYGVIRGIGNYLKNKNR